MPTIARVTTLAEPPRTTPPVRSRGRRWLLGGTVVWALALLAAVYVSVERDPPTVREQSSIEQAAPVVDRAAGELVRAAGDGVVAVVAPPVLTNGCRITSARTGADLRREVTVHTTPAGGPALLDRLRQRLPEAYGVRVRGAGDAGPAALRADAGEFVGIRGSVVRPGVVRLAVATGCRPPSPGFVLDAEPLGSPVDRLSARALVGLTPDAAERGPSTTVPCPAGAVVVTAVATVHPPAMPARLSAVVPAPRGADVLVDEPGRYVYRTGDAGVVVEADEDRVRAAATGNCQ